MKRPLTVRAAKARILSEIHDKTERAECLDVFRGLSGQRSHYTRTWQQAPHLSRTRIQLALRTLRRLGLVQHEFTRHGSYWSRRDVEVREETP